MAKRARLSSRTLDQLVIDDERSFRHVALVGDLARIVQEAGYRFRVLPKGRGTRAQRALLLNLTFWDGQGGDVLVDDHLAADVVSHVAWHHLGVGALGAAAGTIDGMLFAEAIASAFDVYLIGRLLGHAPRSSFLRTQVPAMADAAHDAGLSDARFDALLVRMAGDPERAFEELRELLFDVSTALVTCTDVDAGNDVLGRFDAHPFAALLHHYEISNWVLFARARVPGPPRADRKVRALDRKLRQAPVALDWLVQRWVAPRCA